MIRFNQQSNNGNPFANFNPMTTNQYNGANNFNNAFMNNQPFIEKTDFRNKNNLLHNNVNENTMVEQIIEYIINIDTVDRSLTAFPNPYDFTLTFGGHGKVQEKKIFVKKNVNQSGTINESKYETKKIEYDGTPGPVINREFKNVKYLRIDYIILPRTNIIDISGCILSTDTSDNIAYKYKYIVLKIKEIKSDKILGTNTNLENDTFILYPDKIMGANHIMWLPTAGTRTYKNSNLENLKKLTFEFLTPQGETIYTTDKNNNTINPDIDCVKEYMQVNISVILGIVENELNTNTKFEK